MEGDEAFLQAGYPSSVSNLSTMSTVSNRRGWRLDDGHDLVSIADVNKAKLDDI